MERYTFFLYFLYYFNYLSQICFKPLSCLMQYRGFSTVCGDHKCGHRIFGRSVVIEFRRTNKISFSPHPYGMRSVRNGFSHDLSNSPPDCFLPSLCSGRSFESRYNEKSGDHKCGHRIFGRSIGIRTRGLLDPNQARYQTSPYPEIQYIITGIS